MDEYNIAKILVRLNLFQKDNYTSTIDREELDYLLASCHKTKELNV